MTNLSDMPCSATAAERQHNAARPEPDERVLESVVDEIMDGGKRNGYTLRDFFDSVDPDLWFKWMTSYGQAESEAGSDLKKQMRDYLMDFFREHEAEYLVELEREEEAV